MVSTDDTRRIGSHPDNMSCNESANAASHRRPKTDGHTRSKSSPGQAVLPPPVQWISPQRSPHIAHRKRTKDAIEWVVAEVWRQNIWPPFRPLIAARLDGIRLGAGGRIFWRHQGQQLILTVTEWTPGGEWEAEMRYAVGHLMMYALLVEVAAITAGVNAQTGALPGYRQGHRRRNG